MPFIEIANNISPTILPHNMKQIIKTLRIILALCAASFCFTAVSSANAPKWDVQPKVKKSVAPANPDKLSGMVSAKIVITAAGKVSSAEIAKSTDPALDKPVLDALQKWLFHPAKLEGKPIECTIKVPFKFQG